MVKHIFNVFLLSCLALPAAAGVPGVSSEYDLSASYRFEKQLLDGEVSFLGGDDPYNPCDGPRGDGDVPCETDDDCDDGSGSICGVEGCATKGDVTTAGEACDMHWSERDGHVDPNWGTSYYFETTLASRGTTGPGQSLAAGTSRTAWTSELGLEAHVFGKTVDAGRLVITLASIDGNAAKLVTEIITPIWGVIYHRERTIALQNGSRHIDLAHDKKYLKICKGMKFGVTLQICTQLRATFGVFGTIERDGAAITAALNPYVQVGSDTTVEAGLGFGSAGASVTGGGTINLVDVQFLSVTDIDGTDCRTSTGLLVDGLSGSVWAVATAFGRTVYDDTIWDFGDPLPMPWDAYTENWQGDSRYTRIWDTDDCFKD